MDETWLNEGHRLQKEWVDLVTLNKANRKLLYYEGLTVGCTKTQVGKGKRLIITDAVMQNGPLMVACGYLKKKKRKTEDLSSKNGKQKSVEKIIVAIQRMKSKKRDFYLRKITTTR